MSINATDAIIVTKLFMPARPFLICTKSDNVNLEKKEFMSAVDELEEELVQ